MNTKASLASLIMILFIITICRPVEATVYLDVATVDNQPVNLSNTPVADIYYASMDIFVGNAPNWGGTILLQWCWRHRQ